MLGKKKKTPTLELQEKFDGEKSSWTVGHALLYAIHKYSQAYSDTSLGYVDGAVP